MMSHWYLKSTAASSRSHQNWRLDPKMMLWKMIVLSTMGIFGVHVNFLQGCSWTHIISGMHCIVHPKYPQMAEGFDLIVIHRKNAPLSRHLFVLLSQKHQVHQTWQHGQLKGTGTWENLSNLWEHIRVIREAEAKFRPLYNYNCCGEMQQTSCGKAQRKMRILVLWQRRDAVTAYWCIWYISHWTATPKM